MLQPFLNGTKSGTTTAAYVEALRIDLHGCGGQGKFIAFLKNLHGSNTMFYKVDLYLANGATTPLTKAGKSETSIAANTQIEITTTEVPYNVIVVISVVKNSDVGTYQLDYSTY
jgi:hypothetical protein